MALLNYTTQIAADKTAMEIQTMLSKAGALAIMMEYDNGIASGLTFKIGTNSGPVSYQLPCNISQVLLVLKREPKVPRRLVTPEQAARVGWRILKDWVEAQLAFIQLGQVSLDQVLLSFAITPGGKTVYERYLDRGFSALLLEESRT